MVKKLGETADSTGKNNVSFLSYFLLGDVHKCLEILINTNRLPEAAFFAR
jgi:coatomer subunit beta'